MQEKLRSQPVEQAERILPRNRELLYVPTESPKALFQLSLRHSGVFLFNPQRKRKTLPADLPFHCDFTKVDVLDFTHHLESYYVAAKY